MEPVIVIDLQTGLLDGVAGPPLHESEALIGKAKAVIAWARRQGRKVAFVRHDGAKGDSLEPGSPGWPVWPALGQAENEPIFGKSVGDAFSNSDLEAWAREGANGVILVGAMSDECIAASTRGALQRGLAVTLVSDAHGTIGWGGRTAPEIIAEQNRALAEAGARLVTTAELIGR